MAEAPHSLHSFVENFVVTLKKDEGASPEPFPYRLFTWTHQYFDLFIEGITYPERKLIIVWEKSAQMMGSWSVAASFLWAMLFREHQTFLMVSQKQSLVDDRLHTVNSLLGKVRFIAEHLPDEWADKIHPMTMGIEVKENGSTIVGETAQPDAGRGGGWTGALCDELSFNMYGEENIGAIRPRCYGPLVCLSTPNRRLDVGQDAFSRMRHEEGKPSIRVISTFYHLHPDRQDPAWFAKATEGMTQGQINAEYLGIYGRSITSRCFFTWDRDKMVRPVPYMPGETVYRSWDMSPNLTAIVWVQIKMIHTKAGNLLPQFRIIGYYENSRKPYSHYRKRLSLDAQKYPDSDIEDIGDPYMLNQSDSSMYSWRINLGREEPETPYPTIELRPAQCAGVSTDNLIENVCRHMRLVEQADGTFEPLFLIDSSLKTCIQHTEAYSRPPKRGDKGEVADKPKKDIHSHCAEATQYIVYDQNPLDECGVPSDGEGIETVDHDLPDLGTEVGNSLEELLL